MDADLVRLPFDGDEVLLVRFFVSPRSFILRSQVATLVKAAAGVGERAFSNALARAGATLALATAQQTAVLRSVAAVDQRASSVALVDTESTHKAMASLLGPHAALVEAFSQEAVNAERYAPRIRTYRASLERATPHSNITLSPPFLAGASRSTSRSCERSSLRACHL
jgi:hypothetical protein